MTNKHQRTIIQKIIISEEYAKPANVFQINQTAAEK